MTETEAHWQTHIVWDVVFPFVSRQIPAEQWARQACQREQWGGGGGKSSGPPEDSFMLTVKRLIKIEFSIDVKLPFAPAAGILITGFLL